jgi:hypothetical protein
MSPHGVDIVKLVASMSTSQLSEARLEHAGVMAVAAADMVFNAMSEDSGITAVCLET